MTGKQMTPKEELWTQHSVTMRVFLVLGVALAGYFLLPAHYIGSSGTSFVHLASFATYFGAQIWVTFIGGPTMFKVTPRHVFGHIQSYLFPKFFLLGLITSAVTLTSFLLRHPFKTWTYGLYIQGWTLLFCLVFSVIQYQYLTPVSIAVMIEQHMMEKEAEVPETVGHPDVGDLKTNPKYQKLRSRFVKLHGLSMLLNIFTVVSSVIHMVWLATVMADM